MFDLGSGRQVRSRGVLSWRFMIALVAVGLAGFMPLATAGFVCDDCDTVIQVGFVIDGGESIGAADFDLQLDGIAAAVGAITPDGTLEVTVVQNTDIASLEVGPVLIDSELIRDIVVADILDISYSDDDGDVDDAIGLAALEITDSPLFDCADYQAIIVIAYDDLPPLPINNPVDKGDSLPEDGREYAILMGIDEIDVVEVGDIADDSLGAKGAGFFFEELVYPQPFSSFPAAGYVLTIEDFDAFVTEAITLATELLGNGSADLSISVTATDDVCAGEEVFYTVMVCNNGPFDETGIEYDLALPVGVEYLADSLNSAIVTPDPAGDQVYFSDLSLECGECAEVIVKTRVPSNYVAEHPDVPDPEAAAAFTAIALASIISSADHVDGDTDNNIDSASTFIQECTDLRITRVEESSTTPAGEVAYYRVIVENFGPSDAREVVVREERLSSFVFTNESIQALTDGYTLCNMGSWPANPFEFGVCPGGGSSSTLPAGDRADYRIGRSPVPEGEEVISQSSVSTVTPEFDYSNNLTTTTVQNEATTDLLIDKSVSGYVQDPGALGGTASLTANAVTAGLTMAYSIYVVNNGPSTATNVVVTDLLPAGVSLVEDAVTLSQGSVSFGIPGDPGAPLVCNLGNIESGADPVTIEVIVLVGPNTMPGTVLNNSASVTSDEVDPDNSNNSASAQATVSTWADMQITKISVGDSITGYDADNDREIHTDLPGEVTAGLELRYEITVQNMGPSDAQNVQILDLLPSQTDTGLDHDPVTLLRVVGAEYTIFDELQEIGIFGPGGGGFGQVLWADLGQVPVGARRTIRIYVQTDVTIPEGTTLTNGAFVWWGASSPPAAPGGFLGFPFPQIPPELPTTDDPFTDDNFAATDTNVTAVADLEILKVMTSDGVQPDGTVEFEVTVFNHGPSNAQDLFFTEDWSGINVPVITPNFSVDIPAGQSFTWDVVVEADDSEVDVPEFTNTVEITSTTVDFNLENNISVVVIGGDDTCKEPLAPENLIASDGSRVKEVILTWDAVEDATAYIVYRSATPRYEEATRLATILPNRYQDVPPTPAEPAGGSPVLNCVFDSPEIYFYWVEAVNLCGASEPSNMDQGYAGHTHIDNASTAPSGDYLVLVCALLIGCWVATRRRRKEDCLQQ